MEKSKRPRNSAHSRLVRSIRASLVSSNQRAVAVSRSTKEEFHEFYKIPDDSDIEVVHNGCDARVFRPPNKDHEGEQLAHERIRKEYGCADEEALNYDPKTKTPMILAVGRLVARKGYVSLLRALPLILKEHENAKLVIVGRGHMKKKLLKIADELGVSESLFIKSAMSFEDLLNTIVQQIWSSSRPIMKVKGSSHSKHSLQERLLSLLTGSVNRND